MSGLRITAVGAAHQAERRVAGDERGDVVRAIIPGSNIEIEGDPHELAQLATLLQRGDVLVEHAHHWRVDDTSDGNGVWTGRCACGATRTFAPYADDDVAPAPVGTAVRKCGNCGAAGHTARRCKRNGGAS